MDMTAEAIDRIETLVLNATNGHEIDSAYFTPDWKPVNVPKYEPLGVRTLAAFSEYVQHESPNNEQWVVHVTDPSKVQLVSRALDGTKRREQLVFWAHLILVEQSGRCASIRMDLSIHSRARKGLSTG